MTPCPVCERPLDKHPFQNKCCSTCRIFLFRLGKANFTAVCLEKKNCDVSYKTFPSCHYCRLQKCIKIGITMPKIGSRVHNVVRKIGKNDKLMIMNRICDLSIVTGNRIFPLLDGLDSAKMIADVMLNFQRCNDNPSGPSPSVYPVNLNISILELLYNPEICAPRTSAALDQMTPFVGKPGFRYRFDRSFGRCMVTTADFLNSFKEFHKLDDNDKVSLFQLNRAVLSAFKTSHTKYLYGKNSTELVNSLSNQEGAPTTFFDNMNKTFFQNVDKSVEKLFRETGIDEREAILLQAIALFVLNMDNIISEPGQLVVKQAQSRYTSILAAYVKEQKIYLTESQQIERIRNLLSIIPILRDLSEIFMKSILLMVMNKWSSMEGKIFDDLYFHSP